MEYQEFLKIVGALLKVAVIAMVIERALAFVFEHEWFEKLFYKKVVVGNDSQKTIRDSRFPGLKGLIAFGVAYLICLFYKFNILNAIFNLENSPYDRLGIILTGFVVAGGSAGAITLFQGFLSLGKESRDALIEARKAEAEAAQKIAELKIDLEKAEAEAAMKIAEYKKNQAKANKEKAEIEKETAEARNNLVKEELNNRT